MVSLSHLTPAADTDSFNGLFNIQDLRFLQTPVASVLAQPGGMTCASFQSHAGLMSTTSASTDEVGWRLYRSSGSSITSVADDLFHFPTDRLAAQHRCRPYTVMHPLRPFLSIGYGKESTLRGAGVGSGDDTDSGSYSFLRSQAKFANNEVE